jgi:hypothetical protein
MRQRLVLVVLAVLAFAPPASAELGFFRWWDSLSGPGPFNGIVFDPVFVCHGTKRIPTSGNTATTADAPSFNTFDWGCWNQRRDRLHVNRFAVESRVTVRPLVLLPVKSELTKRRLEFLELRLFGTGIPGEITAADFAATGPWRSDAEWLPGFMIVVRIGSLFRPE